MSFYQPSLSVYDVLNALAGQAQAPDRNDIFFREQQKQQQQQQQQQLRAKAQAEAWARALEQYTGHSHAGRGTGYRLRAPDLESFPAGYYYGIGGQPQYYRPRYYYTGEDDSDEEVADEMGDEEVKEPPYLQVPSYYHSRAPKDIYDRPDEKNTSVQELLSALFGIPASNESSGLANSEENGQKNVQDIELLQGLNKNRLEATKEGEEHIDEKVKDESAKTAAPEPEPARDSRPPIASQPSAKKHSFLHQQVRSPIPDPLQVSKPETRMDLPFSPELNVYDCPEAYVIAVALPGANSKAFRVDYHPSSHELIIKGDLEDKLDIGEEFLKVTELKYGAFQRTLKFPVLPRIKDENIKATYKNGLLQVKVPKIIDGSEKPAPKKRIVIEDIPDEELEFEENPNPVQA